MAWRIGVDIGGTFTDVALIDEASGEIGVVKTLTTPHDFAEGVVRGLRRALAEHGVDPARVSLLSHATTIVTNALLESKGAKAGFIATRGFRDVLELRRSSRADLYDLLQDAPAVLVPRRWRFEVEERIDAEGHIVTPLDEADLDRVVAAIGALGLDTVAVSLMFSFLNDAHERRIGERLRQALPGVGVFLSCEILPEIREFERASTTAVCAYVGPLLASYLGRLENAAAALGLPELHVMGSNGGVIDVAEALRLPAAAIESGPAAGVVAAALAGKDLGLADLISFDMGGTTAKASLIAGGEIAVTAEYEVGGAGHLKRWLAGTGHPVRVPVIDLAEVSAGGGSIAWIDPGGALRVGPQSAGAAPGPAAYGSGGAAPTVSDADIVLGRLDREALLAGALPLDLAAAERAIDDQIARPLGLDTVAAAAKIVEIVDSNMAQALRIVSIERGHDPREFTLVAFGGAGPVHAAALAAELAIPEIVVPPAPGAFSALGLVTTDLKRDYSRTLYAMLDSLDPDRLAGVLAEMEAAAMTMLERAKIPPARRALMHSADLRYRRQAYELTVPMPAGPISRASLDALAAAFHRKHRQIYGHANPDEPVQLVNLRLSAIGRLPRPSLRQRAEPGTARQRRRQVWFAETGLIACPVLWRDGLAADAALVGPAIAEAADSTIVVPPGWIAMVAPQGYIRLKRR
ncbi:MAG TPA: hydantoinase/oxoprolinase family protein [Stellaceae bacterium]|nr:hydantoinase/oxoprolinase family protein [Stellaceae bacterium]